MKVKYLMLFSVFLLMVIPSCTSQDPKSRVYIIEDNPPKLFVIDQEDPLAWKKDTSVERFEANKIRNLRELEDDDELFELKSKLRNVRRSFDGEVFIGFDEDLDNPDLKDVERKEIVDLSNMEKLALLIGKFNYYKSVHERAIPQFPFSVAQDLVLKAYNNPTSENIRNANKALKTTTHIYQFYSDGKRIDALELTREMRDDLHRDYP